jgi:glycerol-3-phosphate dehydrogenase
MANYIEVTGLLVQRNCVTGVTARDILTGDELDIRARIVVNTSGPWLEQVLGLLNGRQSQRKLLLSKAFNLLVNRPLIPHYAVGVYSKGHFNDRDALLSKGSRLFFITPWHGLSLIGTAHLPYAADPDNFRVSEEEIQAFLDEINIAYPAADLKRQDIWFTYSGLLPVTNYGAGDVQLSKRHQIYDHHIGGELDGLISVIGVKFTEARYVAEKVVDLVFKKLGRTPPKALTAFTPIHGGQIEQFSAFVTQEIQRNPHGLGAEITRHLISGYGSEYPRVLKYLERDPALTPVLPAPSFSPIAHCPLRGENRSEELLCSEAKLSLYDNAPGAVVKAEILHGVREEMAHKLTDVIFRRTTLGVAGNPGDACLRICAAIMAQELGWDTTRTQREVEEVRGVFSTRT